MRSLSIRPTYPTTTGRMTGRSDFKSFRGQEERPKTVEKDGLLVKGLPKVKL